MAYRRAGVPPFADRPAVRLRFHRQTTSHHRIRLAFGRTSARKANQCAPQAQNIQGGQNAVKQPLKPIAVPPCGIEGGESRARNPCNIIGPVRHWYFDTSGLPLRFIRAQATPVIPRPQGCDFPIGFHSHCLMVWDIQYFAGGKDFAYRIFGTVHVVVDGDLAVPEIIEAQGKTVRTG